ncbi:unnamed protein product, partial [Iphiclides podalirius]
MSVTQYVPERAEPTLARGWLAERGGRVVGECRPPPPGVFVIEPPNHIRRSPVAPRVPDQLHPNLKAVARTRDPGTVRYRVTRAEQPHVPGGVSESRLAPPAVKIATESKLQLCGGWGGQGGYALESCVDSGLLRPPPQPHSSQLGTVYATKRRRRNGKR